MFPRLALHYHSIIILNPPIKIKALREVPEKPVHIDQSTAMISFLLYVPHFLHTLWGTINAPHLLHFTNVGAVIFQFALLLSLLPLEDLFLGQIDIVTPPYPLQKYL